ncbi:MAG: FAD-binding protein [Acidobacteriia bacterium]|nr:FAD-binding protein [Terriglobia bacterium]
MSNLWTASIANDSSNQVLTCSSPDGLYWTSSSNVPEASQFAAALAFLNDRFLVAFVANDKSNQILTSSSSDGVNWSPHIAVPEATKFAPAVAVFNNRLFLAFVANDSSGAILVTSSGDGQSWTQHLAVQESSKFGPSLAVFNNRLFLAFIANDPSNAILLTSSADGQTWTPHAPVPEASQFTPALAAFDNRLFVAFVANDSSNAVLIASTLDTQTWMPHTALPGASQCGPSMAVLESRLFASFVVNDPSNTVVACSSPDGAAWSSPTNIGQSSKFAPSLIFGSDSPLSVNWTSYERTQLASPQTLAVPQSLADLIAIVKGAETAARKVHAFGSGWAFSDCAVTPDVMVDTHLLNRAINTVQEAFNGSQPPFVFHVEAGIKIHELYNKLDNLNPPLALETMGGASGQSLAGAVSTGTHGGDLFMPPIADSVLAIHLVAAGGAQYWIEPSASITDKARLQQFVIPDMPLANIVYDDNWFNAALVSVGCMGVVYSVVLRVRPQYSLLETTTATTWQSFQQNASSILSDRSFRYLQVTLNPYRDSNGDNFALITRRRELPSGNVVSLRWIASSLGVSSVSGIVQKLGRKWPPPPPISLRRIIPNIPIAPVQSPDLIPLVEALLQLIADLNASTDIFTALSLDLDLLSQILNPLLEELKANKPIDPAQIFNAAGLIVRLVNDVLGASANSGLLAVLARDYTSILTAGLPPVSVADKSFRVMDNTRFRPVFGTPGVDAPTVDPIGGYSIELFFPVVPTADLFGFINAVLTTINSALQATTLLQSFLTGYFSLRFIGGTRAFLGMQQWNPTCALEISVLPGVSGELGLLAAILSPLFDALPNPRNPLPHWGQMLDSASLVPADAHFDVQQAYGNRYPNYAKWQEVYSELSNGFTTRTFENALSTRWQLTYPPQYMTVVVTTPTPASRAAIQEVTIKVAVTDKITNAPVVAASVVIYDDNFFPPIIKAKTSTGANGTIQFSYPQCIDPETKAPVGCSGKVTKERYQDVTFVSNR